MGYIDISPPSVSKSSVKTAYKATLDEGICYSNDSASVSEKAALIRNMWLKNGVLTSRPRLSDTGTVLDGESVHAYIYCFGYEMIHSGSCLYAVKSDECRLLYSGLPDKHSLFAEYSGKLYLYCGISVFSVDRELNAKEEMPYCPVFENKCSTSLGQIVSYDKIVPNILAPVAKAIYSESVSNDKRYHFPQYIDLEKKYYIYAGDRLLDTSEYTVDGNYFILSNDLQKQDDEDISICFYSTHKVFEKCGIIGGCTVAETYGGGFYGGTRVICAGNPAYPGKFFFSELAQPLHFVEGSWGIAGNGNEDITAFSKQYSDLLVFTENTVSRMRYNYTSENGGYFSVHMINSSIGCDMPGSAVCVDNRTVFAHSAKGVYIVDSMDNFDALNILPVSRNITDASGENGFFSVDEELRKAGNITLFDGKLLLHMGDKVFIWDYTASAYVSSSDYAKAESRLTWFEFDGFSHVKLIFSSDNGFYALKNAGKDGLSVYTFADTGEMCKYIYRSTNSGLSYPFNDKYVLNFRFEAKTQKKTNIGISLIADGKKYAEINVHLVPDKDGYAYSYIRLPKYSGRHFAFEIVSDTPDVGILNVGFDYIIKKSIKEFTK